MTQKLGILCIISAPSGTGKSTLIKNLIQHNQFPYHTKLAISYTTRIKRPHEIHGKDYYFISTKEFKHMINKNMFFEYAVIFNHYYGTTKHNIETMLNQDTHVILNIDWKGMQHICKKIPNNIYTIFILPPSKQELEQRLRCRKQDTEQIIRIRMKQSIEEMSHSQEYDYIIINDNFTTALNHLRSIVLSEQLRIIHQKTLHNFNT